MYDTVHIWQPTSPAHAQNIVGVLNDVSEHYKPDKTVYLTGYLDNYRVNVTSSGIYFKGSLAKFYTGDSLKTINREEARRAIEKLQDVTHTNLKDAKVCRFDIARTFTMKHDPATYYRYLTTCNHFKRFEQPTSLYYTNGQRIKLFYDKEKELKSKNQSVDGSNLLRYELRYTNRLPNQFRREITLKTLTNEDFYIDTVQRWRREYATIEKRKIILFTETMKTPKDFFRQLSLFAINQIGLDNLLMQVEEMRERNVWDNPVSYSRLKRQLKEQCRDQSMTRESDFIRELDEKILEVCEN